VRAGEGVPLGGEAREEFAWQPTRGDKVDSPRGVAASRRRSGRDGRQCGMVRTALGAA
jgi:hypothetical protein